MSKHTASFYVQVKPSYRKNGDVSEIRATRITQSAPRKPEPGTVMVRLNLTLPDSVFLPLHPEVDIEIPEHHVAGVPVVESTPVHVLAEGEGGRLEK